jgi:DNA primase catalytic core
MSRRNRRFDGTLRDRVQEANPLAKVVEEYGVELPSAAGDVLVRCCLPGHEDTRPSFSADLDKGSWHCFGCKRGGTVFDLVMCMESVDYGEALRRLAERAGIHLEEQGREEIERQVRLDSERKVVGEVWEAAVAYYQTRLGDEQMRFLRESYGLTEETIQRFRLGYAEGSLGAHLKVRFKRGQLLLSGLFVADDSRGIRDWFRRRIIFPIIVSGEIIEIAGRLAGPPKLDGAPKYLRVGRHDAEKRPYVSQSIGRCRLFGEDSVKRGKPVVVAEGIPDCIRAQQDGLPCVVPMGATFGRDSVQRLISLTATAPEVFVVADAEESGAGLRNAVDTARPLEDAGRNALVVQFPRKDGDPKVDLASFLRDQGRDAFVALCREARTPFEISLPTHLQAYTVRMADGAVMVQSDAAVLKVENWDAPKPRVTLLSGDKPVHVATLALESDLSRARFAKKCSAEAAPTAVEELILRTHEILQRLSAYRAERDTSTDHEPVEGKAGSEDDEPIMGERASFVHLEDEGLVGELVIDAASAKRSFVVCRQENGEVFQVEELRRLLPDEVGPVQSGAEEGSLEPLYYAYRPDPSKQLALKEGAVLVPSGVEEYGTTGQLVSDVTAFVRRYVTVDLMFETIAAYYVLFTWVHDCFSELPYLRAIGDYGSGKSRFLTVIGSISYKPIFGMGATTPSPIFRLIDRYRGTLVLDEADHRNSDTWDE